MDSGDLLDHNNCTASRPGSTKGITFKFYSGFEYIHLFLLWVKSTDSVDKVFAGGHDQYLFAHSNALLLRKLHITWLCVTIVSVTVCFNSKPSKTWICRGYKYLPK